MDILHINSTVYKARGTRIIIDTPVFNSKEECMFYEDYILDDKQYLILKHNINNILGNKMYVKNIYHLGFPFGGFRLNIKDMANNSVYIIDYKKCNSISKLFPMDTYITVDPIG